MPRESYSGGPDERPDPQPCPHCEKLIWRNASDHVCPALLEECEDALREREDLALEGSLLWRKSINAAADYHVATMVKRLAGDCTTRPSVADLLEQHKATASAFRKWMTAVIHRAVPVNEELEDALNTRAGERQDERRTITKYFGG